MALEEKMSKQAPKDSNSLTDAEELDLKIAVLMTERLLQEGGYDTIEKAIDTSSDASQVIGQFFVQLIQELDESVPKEMRLSPRMYLAKGGWLEQVMDMVIEDTGLDTRTADRAEIYVAQMATELANANKQKAQQPQQAAPLPQQGGMA